jgi:hypothetical protein
MLPSGRRTGAAGVPTLVAHATGNFTRLYGLLGMARSASAEVIFLVHLVRFSAELLKGKLVQEVSRCSTTLCFSWLWP